MYCQMQSGSQICLIMYMPCAVLLSNPSLWTVHLVIIAVN